MHMEGEDGEKFFRSLTQERVDIQRVLALYPQLKFHFGDRGKEDVMMKSVRHDRGCLHIETPLGIVNIRVGLTDSKGRSVDSIVVVPDAFMDQPKVVLHGRSNTRLVQLKGGRR